jgi:hypothetical protein
LNHFTLPCAIFLPPFVTSGTLPDLRLMLQFPESLGHETAQRRTALWLFRRDKLPKLAAGVKINRV